MDNSNLKPRNIKQSWDMLPLDLIYDMANHKAETGLMCTLHNYKLSPSVQAIRLVAVQVQFIDGEVIPPGDLAHRIASVLEFGAERYGRDNWRTGFGSTAASREAYLSALCRHLWPADGSTLDPDSGLPHRNHALCNVMFLLNLEKGVAGEY